MELFYKIAYHRMYDHYLSKLMQTIGHLHAEELWKQGDSVNSIGGIVLHICEHIKGIVAVIRIQIYILKMGLKNTFRLCN